MITTEERLAACGLIAEAHRNGARIEPACKEVGISVRTYRRWRAQPEGDKRPRTDRTPASHALSAEERSEILSICHQPEYASLPPMQIVPMLADAGRYIASESSFYRVLQKENELHHRGRAAAPRKVGPPRTHAATGPNQVWTWDVTYLKGPVLGSFFYLYMILDLYSRKIVGWEVWEKESGDYAATLVDRAVLTEQCRMDLRVLHADNGAIQKSSTLQVKLEALGVMSSFNRPRVSNDNAYSESLFRTCKYRPDFPDRGFASIEAARSWVLSFVHWYNTVHRHSALKFVTPAQRHAGLDIVILAERSRLYEAAKKKHPSRWSRGVRNWNPVAEVHLNKRKDEERMMVKPVTPRRCAPTTVADRVATLHQPSRNDRLIVV